MTVFQHPALRRLGLAASGVLALLFSTGAAHAALPIQHWTQANGAEVYLVESPAIPMVDVQIDFDGGARRDPPTQAGLAAVTAAMTGRGVRVHGAELGLDENALGEAWADLGASFSGSADNDRLSFTLRSLTDPALLAKAAELAARQMGEPALPDAIWQRDRERLVAELKEADTRPGTLAAKTFMQAVFGDHPYGQQISPRTLSAISIGDMKAYLDRSVQACGARVSLVGALNKAQADALVTQLLSRVPQGACKARPALPEVQPLSAAQEIRLPFDSAQAHVFIGQPGIARSDPDYFPLLVGNYILGGGGFVSRLTNEVREKRGLSYSVYSYFAPGLQAGAFTLGLQTRPDQAAEAVQVAREVLARFVAEGPGAEELQAAKDNLIGGFALRIDTNRKLLDNVANIALQHLPLDYLDTWTGQVQKVSLADIRAAFARHLQPDRMVTVMVGARP